MEFERITTVKPNEPKTWQNKIFVTLDMEWATDTVLSFCLELLDSLKINATILCTHETGLLKSMKENSRWDLGLHPNFNFLLQGDFRYGKNISEVLDYYRNILPEAPVIRSHSLVQSTPILSEMSRLGFQYELNTFVPHQSGIPLKPWVHWDDRLIRIPFSWEDDVWFLGKNEKPRSVSFEGLRVYNFHPIHLYLNTDEIGRYEAYKKSVLKGDNGSEWINGHRYGCRNFFEDLINELG